MDNFIFLFTMQFLLDCISFIHLHSADIDECAEEISGCQQNCTNTVPGYTCSCNAGYTLNVDGHACDGEYL